MAFWAKIKGIVGNIFTLGISSTAHALKDNVDGVAVRNNSDTQNANIVVARPQGVNQDVHGATYLDVKERVIDIEFAFNGSSYTPGSNNGKYGFCHTSGGAYTAGAIYLESGLSLDQIPQYKMMMACSRLTFTGTVSMVEDGLYMAESGIAPYSWTLKGDGGASGAGIVRVLAVPFSFTDIGTPVYSTSSIPSGAKVLRSTVRMDVPFSGGSNPTCLVEVDGSTVDTVLQATSDNNVSMSNAPNHFDNEEIISIPTGQGGRIRITLGGTATTGSGEVMIMYVQPLN
jgi:hypothetical protein